MRGGKEPQGMAVQIALEIRLETLGLVVVAAETTTTCRRSPLLLSLAPWLSSGCRQCDFDHYRPAPKYIYTSTNWIEIDTAFGVSAVSFREDDR